MGFRMVKIFLTSSDPYGENMFDLGLPLKVKGQGQTLKTLMSNISKTVRNREKVSIDVQ